MYHLNLLILNIIYTIFLFYSTIFFGSFKYNLNGISSRTQLHQMIDDTKITNINKNTPHSSSVIHNFLVVTSD